MRDSLQERSFSNSSMIDCFSPHEKDEESKKLESKKKLEKKRVNIYSPC